MSDIQLIVNDEPLDLKENERIPLTLQAQSFANIADKKGGFSRSFTIPMTDKNKRLLNFTNEFNYATDFPYDSHDAILICFGTELQPGKIIVENDGVSVDEIRITYYTGNSPFFQLISQLKLKEIGLGDGNHFFTWTQIALNDNGSDYFYPIIDYTGSALNFTALVREVFYENIYPAVWYHRAIEGLEGLLGYQFTGTIFQSNDFLKAFFPTSEEFARDTNYYIRNTWNTQRNTTESISSNQPFTLTVDEIVLSDTTNDVTPATGSYLELATGTGVGGNTLIPQGFIAGNRNLCLMFCDTVRLHFKLTFDVLVATASGTGTLGFQWIEFETNRITKEFFTDDPNIGSTVEYWGNPINSSMDVGGYAGTVQTIPSGGIDYHFINTDNIPATAGGTSYSGCTIEFDVDVKAHMPYYMRFYSSFIIADYSNLKCECSFVIDKGTTESDREIQLLDMNKDYWSKAIVSGTTPLPNIKVNDFLKNLAQQFNCIILVDDDKKQVEFFTVDELFKNIPYSKDWSEKVVNIDRGKWNTRANNYGIKSTLKYENEENISPILGQYQMPVNDTTLQEEVDIIKVTYSATEMKTLDGISYAEILRVEDGKYKKGKQRILYSNYLTTGFPTGVSNITKKNNPALGGPTYTLTTGFMQLCYFNQANQPRQMGFDAYLFETYYRFLEYITDKFKQLTVDILLTPIDIANIDFRYPVYLSQFSSYFYVEKIQDWTPGKPCKVQLLKLQ